MRRFGAMLVAMLMVAGVLMVSADDDDAQGWQAWLHDGAGRLVLIDSDGERLDRLTLPLLDTVQNPNIKVVVSSLNRFIVYTAAQDDSQRLRIYRIADETVIYEATSTGEFSDIVFNADDSQLAYGVGGDESALVTVNLRAGTVLQQITPSDNCFPDDFAPSEVEYFTPEYYMGERLIFSRLGETAMSYEWDIDLNIMIALPNYPRLDATDDFAPSGEQIAIQSDTLIVYDPLMRRRTPFFTLSTLINQAKFVQNGHLILIYGDAWQLIRRDGTILRPLPSVTRTDIHNVVDGFVYRYWNDERGITELVHYDASRAMSDRTVWFGEGEWRIVWVDDGATAYGGYMSWAQIGEALIDPPAPTLEVEMQPTGFPTPDPIIYVGLIVEVNTVDGEVLYLRDEPSTGGGIVMNLLDGMALEVIGDSVQAEGFVWWQVVNEDGVEGWAAEAVDTVTTLLPR